MADVEVRRHWGEHGNRAAGARERTMLAGVTRRCGTVLLAAVLAAAAPASAATPAADLGRVLARTPVPDAARQVGEVLLVERGDADVVATLLDTKLLRRVVAEIRAKERANWPEGTAGHADSTRYVAALERVSGVVAPPQRPVKRRARPRVRLYIDFVLTGTASQVAIGAFDLESGGGAGAVVRQPPLAVLDLSRDYVRRNMRLIAADAFGRTGAALDRLLAPLKRLRGP